MRPLVVRLLVSASAVVVAGGAAGLVLADPKPPGAPLHPPLVVPVQSPLVIPAACGPSEGMSAAVAGDYAVWERKSGPERAQYLATLPAAQRLQLEAHIRALKRTTGCSPAGVPGATLSPSAVNVSGGGADIGSYVS